MQTWALFRHIAAVTLSLLLNADDHLASCNTAMAARRSWKRCVCFSLLTKLIGESAHQGPRVATALAAIADWQVEIVKRANAAGFHVLPKRRSVERTFTWFGRCCRPAKGFKNLNRTAVRLPLARFYQALASQTDKGLVMSLNRSNKL